MVELDLTEEVMDSARIAHDIVQGKNDEEVQHQG